MRMGRHLVQLASQVLKFERDPTVLGEASESLLSAIATDLRPLRNTAGEMPALAIAADRVERRLRGIPHGPD